MYMSTPVLADGVLYGLSSKKKGQVVAVDAATGALKWATEGRAADQAAILLTPAHVLVLTTGGELVLVKRSAGKIRRGTTLHRRRQRDLGRARGAGGRLDRA